jgi:uncharacterized protein YkwD
MKRHLTACLAVTLLTIVARAAEEPFAPSSGPPTIGFVHSIDGDKGIITALVAMSKPVFETRTKIVEQVVDGVKMQKQVAFTVTRWVTELQLRQWSAKDGNAVDPKGNVLTMSDLSKRLKKSDAILIAAGKKVDSAYLQVLKPDAVILLGPAEAAGTPAEVPPPMPVRPSAPKNDLSEIEQKVLELVNAHRKEAKLTLLAVNPMLMKAARNHSANMAKQDVLEHELDGKGPGERVADLGYKSQGIAENCAAGQRTPAEVVEAWMNSDGHKANILGENYTEVGIGLAKTTDGKAYWTLVFGSPVR